jgi:hypothetical protein
MIIASIFAIWMESMSKQDQGGVMTRQGRMMWIGLIFIAWGIVGAVISYVSDSNSFDLIRMLDASDNAILHAVLWIAVGGGILLWSLAGPGSSPQQSNDDRERL